MKKVLGVALVAVLVLGVSGAALARWGGPGMGMGMGFGPQRVRSLPDGIAQALIEYLGQTSESPGENGGDDGHTHADAPVAQQLPLKIGDLCPACGEATFVNEEGCRKCYSCGHSEC